MHDDELEKNKPTNADETTVFSVGNHETAHFTDELDADQTIDFSLDPAAVNQHLNSPVTAPSAGGQSKTGATTIPGYRILGELGHGGMGVVYRAKQIHADRIVALKVMLNLEHAGPEELARFRLEAQASAQLQHPNIVQVYEVGEHKQLPYFTLEYVNGGTLAEKITKQLLSHHDTARLMVEATNAMAYAHSKEIIHRDLKPANILLNKEGSIKIADFGLARRTDDQSHMTRDGTIIGTPSYMAPEQASGSVHEIGRLSDVYSLGAILYELLTGRPPFKGATVWEVINLVRTADPTPPSDLRPDTPKDLETICMKCLQKAPEKRYTSATNLAADLQRYLNDEPILARPVSQWERLIRLCRRHPREARLIGVVASILLLSAVGASWAAWHISSQRDQIAQEKETSDGRLELYRDSVSNFVNRMPQLLEGVPLAEGAREKLGDLTEELLSDSAARDVADVGVSMLWGREALEIRAGDLLLDTASALKQSGAPQADIERPRQEAEVHFRQAKTIAQTVLDSQPEETDKALANLALAISRQATARLIADDWETAEKLYSQAIQYRTEAKENNTGSNVGGTVNNTAIPISRTPRALRDAELGREHCNLAAFYLARAKSDQSQPDDVDAALRNVNVAIQLLEDSLADFSSDDRLANIHRDLALATNLLSSIGVAKNDQAIARDGFEKTVRLNQELVAMEPLRIGHQRNLIASANSYGDFLLVQTRDATAARSQYVIAMLQLRRLLSDSNFQQLQEDGLAMGYYRLGLVAVAQGNQAQSQKYFSRCVLIRELDLQQRQDSAAAQQNPDLLLPQRISLMLAQARCGSTDSAIAEARRLVARAADAQPLQTGLKATQLLQFAAAGLGIVSEKLANEAAEVLLEEAILAMEKSIDLGFDDTDYLTTDPDMAPLQKSNRFSQLLERIRTSI